MEYFINLFNARYLSPEVFWWAIPLFFLLVFIGIKGKRTLVSLAIRTISLFLILLALADPIKENQTSKKEIAVLFDASYSIGQQAEQAFVQSLKPYVEDGLTQLNVLPFAKTAGREFISLESGFNADNFKNQFEKESKNIDTGDSNLAAAISSISARTVSSAVLLLTDGQETVGDARQAATTAAQQGLRIYPVVPDPRLFEKEQLYISSIEAPITAQAGDVVEVRTSIKNSYSENSRALLELWLENEKLYSQRIEISAEQEKLLNLKTPPLKGGLKRLRAVLKPDKLESTEQQLEKYRWISVKEKSKILLLSGSKDDNRVLKQLISLKGYALEDVLADGTDVIPDSLSGYSSVIFNNTALHQLPRTFLPTLKKFVEDGGGLLIVGGDRSFGLGNYINTALEEMSPVKFVPPQTEKRRLNNAIVLVIDKSGSMAEEGKIVAAREAALSSMKALKDEDYISVIGFDAVPFVIIDLKQVRDAKLEAPNRLRNLTATGKTDLLPALAKARERLQKAPASRKHIIVLSDGKFPLSGDAYVDEINRLRKEGISVSAVALGIEADIPFMKILAKYGKGAFYHTLDAYQLPKIFVDDIMVSTGEKTLKEGLDVPVSLGPDGLNSTTVGHYPPLRGFVEALPKKGASLELLTKRNDTFFPLLASWKWGQGKVIAFTSDANGRWSLPWLQWTDFGKFWSQIIESVKDRSGVNTGDIDFDLRYSLSGKAITFDLAIYDEKLRTELAPRIVAEVSEPTGEKREVLFRSVKKGRFEARLDNAKPGDYKLEISYGKLKLPMLALNVSGEALGEVKGRGVNARLLDDIAFISKGFLNPRPEDILATERTIQNKEHLFMPLVILAFLLILFEAFVRERGFFDLKLLKKGSDRFTKLRGNYGPKRRKLAASV